MIVHNKHSENISVDFKSVWNTTPASITFFYLALFLLDWIFALIWNVDWLTLSIFISFCVVIFLVDFRFFLKYILFFYEYFSNIVGVYIIENNEIILSELNRESCRYGSLWLITFSHWFFFIVLFLNDDRVESFFKRRSSKKNITSGIFDIKGSLGKLFPLFVLFCLLFLFFNAAKQTAGEVHLDRFEYAHFYITGLWALVNEVASLCIPFIAMLLCHNKKISFAILMGIYFLYLFMIGHKFGAYITALYCCIPYIVNMNIGKAFSEKTVKLILTVLLIAGLSVVSVYSFMVRTYGLENNKFRLYLIERLEQQGQLWWAVFGHEREAGLRIDEMINSMGALFKLDEEILANNDYGIYKIMKLVTPSQIYNNKISHFSRYAFSTDSSFYYYLKTPGLIIFTFLMSLMVIVIVNWYWRDIHDNNILNVIISGRFYIIVIAVITQSDFNVLFSRRNVLFILIYFGVRWCCIRMNMYRQSPILLNSTKKQNVTIESE